MSKRHCSSVKGLFISGSESVDIHFEKKINLDFIPYTQTIPDYFRSKYKR